MNYTVVIAVAGNIVKHQLIHAAGPVIAHIGNLVGRDAGDGNVAAVNLHQPAVAYLLKEAGASGELLSAHAVGGQVQRGGGTLSIYLAQGQIVTLIGGYRH